MNNRALGFKRLSIVSSLAISSLITLSQQSVASEVILNQDFAEQGRLTINLANDESSHTRFVFQQFTQLDSGDFLLAFNEEKPPFYTPNFPSTFRGYPASVKLVKVSASGAIDTQFGNGGVYDIPHDYWDRVVGLEKLSNGKLMLIVEGLVNECATVLKAYQLTPQGNIDESFGTQGGSVQEFNTEGYCTSLDYDEYNLVKSTAVTEQDDVLVVVSGPGGGANTSYLGEIPIMISPTGDIKIQERTACAAFTHVTPGQSMLCGDRASDLSIESAYSFERLDFTNEQNSFRQDLDFKSFLPDVHQDDSYGLQFLNYDMTGNTEGDAWSLFNISQEIVVNGNWETVYDKRVLLKLNSSNELDTDAFNTGVLTETDLPQMAEALQIAAGADEKLLLLGNGFVSRINQSGELDQGFGNDGSFEFVPAENTQVQWLHDAESQDIYLAESGTDTLTMRKLTPDGTPDITFADGGVFTFSIDDLNNSFATAYSRTSLRQTSNLESGTLRVALENSGKQLEAQVTENGQLDLNFGVDGFAEQDVTESGKRLQVTYLDDGAYLVLTENGLFRYSPLGELDTSFAQSGAYLFSSEMLNLHWYDLMRFEDGSLMITADTGELSLLLIQLSENGVPNGNFAQDGQKVIDLSETGLGMFSSQQVPIEADQIYSRPYSARNSKHQYTRVLAGDKFDVNLPVTESRLHPEFSDLTEDRVCFYKLRFDSTGTMDMEFGNNGAYRDCNQDWDVYGLYYKVPFAQFQVDNHENSVLQLLSEEYLDQDAYADFSTGLSFIKLTGDGSLDTSFGNSGIIAYDFRSLAGTGKLSRTTEEGILGAAMQPDGKTLVAVQFGHRPYRQAIFRFNTDGSQDPNFGTSGVFWFDENTQLLDDNQYLDLQHFVMQSDQIYISGEFQGNGIVLNLTEQNSNPVFADDINTRIELDEDTSSDIVELVATDDNGDGLQWQVSQPPGNGTVQITENSSAMPGFTYTPNNNFNGSDSFDITVQDWRGGLSTQSFTVDVASVNDAPTVQLSSDNDTVSIGTEVNLTAAATDIDGDTITISWIQVSGPEVVLTTSDQENTSFIAPEVSSDTQIVLSATASDGQVETSSSITISVEAPVTVPVNDEPRSSSGGAFYHVWLLLVLFARRLIMVNKSSC